MAGWFTRLQMELIAYLQEENRVLRERLKGKRIRFTDDRRRRLAAKAKALGRKVLCRLDTLVTPDTLLAWRRKLIAWKYDGGAKRGPGRPQVMDEIRTLVAQMARENASWGDTRIRGALSNLGHEIGRGTIANILKEHGIDPAPARTARTSWRDFLRTHWDVMAATGFFTVEVWSLSGLVRYSVLFVSELSLRRTITEFVTHYHQERNHQGLDNRLIEPEEGVGQIVGQIQCRERLGGMLKYYNRDAA